MRKIRSANPQPQNQKGRVLARELAEDLRYVPGGKGIGTFTAPPDPDWPPDRD
jgi:hypothetical protein